MKQIVASSSPVDQFTWMLVNKLQDDATDPAACHLSVIELFLVLNTVGDAVMRHEVRSLVRERLLHRQRDICQSAGLANVSPADYEQMVDSFLNDLPAYASSDELKETIADAITFERREFLKRSFLARMATAAQAGVVSLDAVPPDQWMPASEPCQGTCRSHGPALLVSVLAFVFANWISSEAAAAGTTARFAAAAAVRAELLGSSSHDPRIELTQASPENAADPRLQRLFDLLDSDDAMERASNLDTLSHITSQADTILPVMRARLKLSSPIRKSEAAWIIGSLSKGAAEDVTALTGLLSDPNVRVRAAAVLALGQIGPAAAAALPALTSLPTRDQNTDTTIKCLNGSDVSCRAARQAFSQQNPMLRLMLEQGVDPNRRPQGVCMCSFLALRQGSHGVGAGRPAQTTNGHKH